MQTWQEEGEIIITFPYGYHAGYNAMLKCEKRVFTVRPSWDKADALHIEQYKKLLQNNLSNIAIPSAACLCDDVLCNSDDHVASLNRYAAQITEACHRSVKDTIPRTKPRSKSGCIPGWTEFVAPLRARSIFWHNLWLDCGKPHTGYVADIMRKTRARYHVGMNLKL